MWRKSFRLPPRWRAVAGSLFAAVVYPAWTFGAVFVVGAAITSLVVYLSAFQLGITLDGTQSLQLMVINMAAYIVGLALLLTEPYALRRMTIRAVRQLLGIARRVHLRDLGYAILSWSAYIVIAYTVTVCIATVLPSIDMGQRQDIGFATNGTGLDKLYAFILIVMIAPLVEELIFRGYQYGSLRRRMPWWLGAVITSVLFGFVHGQWNVGIDVFMMSMVMCYLREYTGAIWSGVMVHMLKNSLAYYLLFFAPPWVLKLLGA